jgi:hypothetical protein
VLTALHENATEETIMAANTEQTVEELVSRTRELNERIITASKQAGET